MTAMGKVFYSRPGRKMNPKERTYRCPKCGRVVKKTAKEMKNNRITKGQLPAFLLCGACFSKHRDRLAPRMWGDDILEEDRNDRKYTPLGIERLTGKPKYEQIKDISFGGRYHGKCVRYLVHEIVHGRMEDNTLIVAAVIMVEAITYGESVNAIAVRFCRSRGEAIHGITVAEVAWCPGGVWGDADTVKTGDYTKHEYHIAFNRT